MKAQAPIVKHDSAKIFALLYIFRVMYIDLIWENKKYKRRNKYGFIKTVIFGKDNKASSQTSFNNRRLENIFQDVYMNEPLFYFSKGWQNSFYNTNKTNFKQSMIMHYQQG